MPWHIAEQDGKHCVVKDDTNETVTCHDSEEQAKAHIAALYANEPSAAKAGARHSRQDQTMLQTMHDHSVALGASCDMGEKAYKADACPHCGAALDATVKAGALDVEAGEDAVIASVKALGDRTLELRVAWGWDGHKEQFTPQTDFDLENFPSPPVAYYHGYTEKGKPAPKPIYIGKTLKRENRADGHYLTTKLNSKPEADRVWQAALEGKAVVSPGTAGHLRRKAADGTLTYWPIVEISAWDYADSRKPAHPKSVAFPVLKALYDEAGMDVPALLDTPPPEAPGDGASAGSDTPPDLSPEEVARYIVTQVASAALANSKRTS